MKGLIPHLIQNGFDCIQPLEAKAGMDLLEIKDNFGEQIALFGGIDVTILETNDFKKIEEEISNKINYGKQNGGYLYHSDHSISNKVELHTYKFVIDCVLRYGKY